ncbi:MAG: hypothetical protein ACR2P3_02210, partial [Geminicoccaceae bacterium]
MIKAQGQAIVHPTSQKHQTVTAAHVEKSTPLRPQDICSSSSLLASDRTLANIFNHKLGFVERNPLFGGIALSPQ